MTYHNIPNSLESQTGLPLYSENPNELPIFLWVDENTQIEMNSDKILTLDDYPQGIKFEDFMENKGVSFDDNGFYFIFDDELEQIGVVKRYYEGAERGEATFYKGDGVYAVDTLDGQFYIWTDLSIMLQENLDAFEAFHRANDKIKNAYFGEKIKNIKNIVMEDGQYNRLTYTIKDFIKLEPNNPANYFEYVGVSVDDELIYYVVNNTNVSKSDLPRGYEIHLSEVLKANLDEYKEDYEEEQKLGYNGTNCCGLPTKNIEEIVKLTEKYGIES